MHIFFQLSLADYFPGLFIGRLVPRITSAFKLLMLPSWRPTWQLWRRGRGKTRKNLQRQIRKMMGVRRNPRPYEEAHPFATKAFFLNLQYLLFPSNSDFLWRIRGSLFWILFVFQEIQNRKFMKSKGLHGIEIVFM